MSSEILINLTPQETRVAILENGVLQELLIERTHHRGIVGNIYKGKVIRVMPGMDAAFVDIGEQRAAFLHVADIVNRLNEPDEDNAKPVSITEVLSEDQELLVQVIKDPIGTKGARLTAQITVPSRYLVYMPNSDNIGISAKIEDEDTREKLKTMVEKLMPKEHDGGYIVRTVAETASEDSLSKDAAFLRRLWSSIEEQQTSIASDTRLVHEDLPLVLRTLRDVVDDGIDRIRVDSKENHQKMLKFSKKYLLELEDKIEHYFADRPIFDLYSVEDEIKRALERKVKLKSGGYLIIDQTEAMTTIDVNTGGFVGHRTLEETIYKTNLEAAQAIARQLRLRNLGGIIIIDFIDMTVEEHKRQVFRALEKSLEKDHARTKLCHVSELGLIEMTRKRTRESLEHVLCQSCPTCDGRGSIKTAETICYEIFREILQVVRMYDAKNLMVLASQEVTDLLLDEESRGLSELETFLNVSIKFQVEISYIQEQYDVVIV